MAVIGSRRKDPLRTRNKQRVTLRLREVVLTTVKEV
jgi:hypothetical protein